jgi:hypothetical protein
MRLESRLHSLLQEKEVNGEPVVTETEDEKMAGKMDLA